MPKADLFRQTRTALRIAGCGHWMLTGEGPTHAVLLDAQSMAGREMPFEHLAAPAAIEADDIIAMNGLDVNEDAANETVEIIVRKTARPMPSAPT